MVNLTGTIAEQVVVELAKKGVTESDIELVGTKGGSSAVGIFVAAFMQCLQQVKNAFPIMAGGTRTTDEVIVAGNYDGKNAWVNGESFPMRPMPEGPREIVFLEFDHEPDSEEVLAEAARQSLERPRYEDALFFGEQHPEEQRECPIVFLHEPTHCNLRVLVLLCLDWGRVLDLNYFDGVWRRQCRFAFVRKSLRFPAIGAGFCFSFDMT